MSALLIAQAALFAFAALMVYAAVSDALTMTIPNRASLAMIAAFAAYAPFSGLDLGTLGAHAGAGALVLAVGFGMFALNWLGGGDAKIAAGGALWFGFSDLFPFLLYTAVAGGFVTFAVLVVRNAPLPIFVEGSAWISRFRTERKCIPYGVAIAVGALAALPHSVVWRAAFAG